MAPYLYVHDLGGMTGCLQRTQSDGVHSAWERGEPGEQSNALVGAQGGVRHTGPAVRLGFDSGAPGPRAAVKVTTHLAWVSVAAVLSAVRTDLAKDQPSQPSA